MPSLTAKQADALAQAERAVVRAKAALAEVTGIRERLRDRYRDRVPAGQLVTVGEYEIARTPTVSGERFDLKAFRESYELTAEMLEHVKPGSPYERWTVKPGAHRRALGLGL